MTSPQKELTRGDEMITVGPKAKRLETILGNLLREKKFTISCAESCTGGLLTNRFTDVSGSSDYVEGSIVSYSNKVKNNILQVSSETLKNYGAVSEEVANEMAMNVREILNTTIGLSTTGIAGPTGATENKPIGLVFIGVSSEQKTVVRKFNFTGNRIEIKNQAVEAALIMLHEFLTAE